MSKSFFAPLVLSLSLLSACAPNRSKDVADVASAMSKNTCANALAQKLGIDWSWQTSPAELQDILDKDMYLADLKPLRAFLGTSLTSPQPLAPMMASIAQAFSNRFPAMQEFVCTMSKSNLVEVPTPQSRAQIKRMLSHTYLLDRIVSGMASKPELMTALHQHHLTVRRTKFGISDDNFMRTTIDMIRVSGELFEAVKGATVDAVYGSYELIRSGQQTAEKTSSSQPFGITGNIMEAVAADLKGGNNSNALSGLAIALNPAKDAVSNPKTTRIEYDLSQEWNSLYETWNFAFITGHLPNLHLFYPKLLIPCMLNAPEKEYIFYRALALWPTLNFDMFAKGNKKPLVQMPHAKEISRAWSEMNLRYAKNYIRNTPAAKNIMVRKLYGLN